MDHNYARIRDEEGNDIPSFAPGGERRSVDHDHLYAGIPEDENTDIPGSGDSEGEGVRGELLRRLTSPLTRKLSW